jgi:ketosteroid isomerase-like protein
VVERTICGLWTLSAGKVERVAWFPSKQEAIAAAKGDIRPPAVGNVELARRLMEIVSRPDADELVAMSHPEVEWRSFFAVGEEGGVYRGHDGIRRYLKDIDDAMVILRPEVEDTIAVGDIVVLVGRVHYKGRESGAESEVAAGWVLEFRGGKLISFRAFREPERALAAIGLSA